MADYNKYKHMANSASNKVYAEKTFSYEQLINYYPKYNILDELLNMNESATHINFFFDLKNIMQTIYLEFAMRYLINDSIDKGQVSSWGFEAFIAYIGFHKEYALARQKTATFYVFFESGHSGYHKNIYKGYKSNRTIDIAFGLTESEVRLNRDIWQKNLLLIEKVGNKLPDVYVFHMQKLEADFIPYYLMSRNKVDMSDNVLNITYSTDHDLYQNNLLKNTYTYYRHRKNMLVFDKYKIIDHYMKNKTPTDLDPEYYPIFIAMCGDVGDGIPVPIRGAGKKTIHKIIKEFVEICGGIENIYSIASNLNNKELISKEDINNLNIKNIQLKKFVDDNHIIMMNLRLMSFEILSRMLDNPVNNMLEKRKHIEDIIDNKKVVESNILYESLTKINIHVERKHYDKVFFDAKTTFDEISNNF